MNRLLLILTTCVLLTTCKGENEGKSHRGTISNLTDITENEHKGIQEILSFYGGECRYAVKYSISSSEGKKKYFEIEVGKSELLEKLVDRAEIPASNIAYFFYSNLKSEQNNYDEIHTTIVFSNGSKKSYSCKISRLQLIEKRITFCLKIVQYLKNKQYDEIKKRLNNSFIGVSDQDSTKPYNINKLISSMQSVDEQLGTIQGFNLHGFYKNPTTSPVDILHVSGVLLRDTIKNSHEFSIDINFTSDKEDIYLIQYNF
jgi:hypothetical protein